MHRPQGRCSPRPQPGSSESCRPSVQERLNFFGREENAVAWLTHHAELPARVVVQHHRKLDLVLEVLLDGFDHGNLAGQSYVHDVCFFLWPYTDAVPNAKIDPEDAHTRRRHLRLLERIPFAIHCAPSRICRRLRMTPCDFSMDSAVRDSVRSR